MDPRLIVLFILPTIVRCYQCNEEFLNETRTIRQYYYSYGSSRYIDEITVQNSTIHCSNFTELTTDMFTNYQPQNYEQVLKIQESNISTLPTAGFSKLSFITKLYLNGIHVRLILPEAFRGLSKLRELYLADNELSKISKGVFNSLHQLDTLDLSNNRISSIEEFAFMGLDNLKKIFLNKNQLSVIDEETFQTVKTLNIFDLSQNSLKNFSFDGMTITTLNLSSNDLEILDFYKFPKCTLADFSQNRISSVEDLEQAKISDLILSNNHLKYLNGTLGHVRTVSLSHNEIESLSLNFNSSGDLLEIDLNFNQIVSFDDNTFQDLRSLKSLDVSHNNLSLIQQVLFHDLENLLTLNLSHNHIERFRFGTFDSLKNLLYLDISHNLLSEFDYHNFIPMSQLNFLYFESNQIDRLNATDLTSHFMNLTVISLSDNLWKCKDLASVFHHFDQHHISVLRGHRSDVENIYGVACSSQISQSEVDKTENQKQVLVKVNTSLDDSSFVRFFNSSFRNTNFFKYFDNKTLRINTSLDDSSFVRFFNSSFRNTEFFQYLASF